MGDLILLEKPNDTKEALMACIDASDDYECVLILAIDKSGQVVQKHSTVTLAQMSIMTCAQNAYMKEWFFE